MRSKRVLAALGVLVLLVISGSVAAQTSRRNFTRSQTYDVQHYTLRISFDRSAKKVIGDTSIRFKAVKDKLKTAEFDAVGISFSSVTSEPSGKPVTFRTSSDSIVVTLDKEYSAGEEITLRFKHTAAPKKGVYFVDEEIQNGRMIHSDQIWTQGEADEGRHWFPSFDFPSDKATTEQYITAKSGETVVGNGEFVEEVKNADGTVTHHFRMNVPHSTYLISFVIGKYVRVSDQYGATPLGFFVYPGSESVAKKAFGDTKEMMKVFETLTKVEFPFNKYDQTIVSGFTFGGMENVTATTMADTEIFAIAHPLFAANVGDLVSHELAHSWFGNLVTCKNWAELWLNEGFATFMEAAFREKKYGRKNYMIKIISDAEEFITDDAVNKKRNALFNQNADNVAALFDRPATIYDKGGAVLHTLREEIGDEAFWKGVNIYLTRHKFGSVESTDLIAAMEEASNRDLNWFFDQWVYRGGHPKLNVTQVWDEATKTLSLTIAQTQKNDGLTPGVFRLPMDLEADLGDKKELQRVEVTKRSETFKIKLPSRPKEIKLDPLDKIPVKTVKMGP